MSETKLSPTERILMKRLRDLQAKVDQPSNSAMMVVGALTERLRQVRQLEKRVMVLEKRVEKLEQQRHV